MHNTFNIVAKYIAYLFLVLSISLMSGQSKAQNNAYFKADVMEEEVHITSMLEEHFSDWDLYKINTNALYRFAATKAYDLSFILDFEQHQVWEFDGFQKDIKGASFDILSNRNGQLESIESSFPMTLEGNLNGHRAVFTLNEHFLAAWVLIGEEKYYLEQLNQYISTAPSDQYLLYREEAVLEEEVLKCGVEVTRNNKPPKHSKSSTTPFPDICLDFLAVADSAFYSKKDTNTVNQVVSIFNAMNDNYANNNIGVSFNLTGIVIFEDGDPYEAQFNASNQVNASSLLTDFTAWRNDSSQYLPTNDLAHLYTSYVLLSGIFGLAGQSEICDWNSTGINRMSAGLPKNSALLTHEVGHNLGSRHDGEGNACVPNNDLYFMSPSVKGTASTFSDCSKDYFESLYETKGVACAGCIGTDCFLANPIDCLPTITEVTIDVYQEQDTLPSCNGFIDMGAAGIWYTFTGDGDILQLSTCSPNTNFNTQIGVFTGNCNNLICVDGNDDDMSCSEDTTHATLSIQTIADETYYVFVSGRNAEDEGTFELKITKPNLEAIVYFVDAEQPDGGDGLSWNTAFNDLQVALDSLNEKSCDQITAPNIPEIWLANGTYLPSKDKNGISPSDPRDATFFLDFDVKIYGGFAGHETSIAERDWQMNTTIISGDLGTLQDTSDNAYTIWHFETISNKCILDGLTMQDGNASGTDLQQRSNGSACYLAYPALGTISIENCTFKNNNSLGSGAIFISGQPPFPYITINTSFIKDCFFYDNHAGSGAAIYSTGADSIVIVNSLFQNNRADFSAGGVFMNNGSILDCTFNTNTADFGAGVRMNAGAIMNCVFNENTAADRGAGVWMTNGSISSCTFKDNVANLGGGIYYNSFNGGTIANSIFYNNQAEQGAGIFYNGAKGKIINSSFHNNASNDNGGDIWIETFSDSLTISNSIFGNNAGNGESIFNRDTLSVIQQNCDFIDTVFVCTDTLVTYYDTSFISIHHSLLEENNCPNLVECGGGMLFNQDPEFVDSLNGDLRLRASSPARDVGDNSALPMNITTDIAGYERIQASTVDMGAYEGCASTDFAIVPTSDPMAVNRDTMHLLAQFGCDSIVVRDTFLAPTLSITDAEIVEGDIGTTQLLFDVSLSSMPTYPVVVDFATQNGTAENATDFTAQQGQLTFSEMTTFIQIAIEIIGDLEVESNEDFSIQLSNLTNAFEGTMTATGTIQNDDLLGEEFCPQGTQDLDNDQALAECDCDDDNPSDGFLELSNQIVTDTFQSSIILATGTIANEDTVLMQAYYSIVLDTGFVASMGSTFTAKIVDCPTRENLDQFAENRSVSTEIQSTQLLLYPNPTSGLLRYEFSDMDEVLSIQIYDLYGQLVMEQSNIDGQLSLANLPSGLYLFVLRTAKRDYLQRAVKE